MRMIPVVPGPVSLPVDSPAVTSAAEEQSQSAKVRQEFLGVLVAQLMKEGFFGSESSASFGDGPQKEFIKNLMAETLAHKMAEAPAFQYRQIFPEKP